MDAIDVIIFIIVAVGGVIAEIIKKAKTKREMEEAERDEEMRQSSGAASVPIPPPPPAPAPYTAPKPPKKAAPVKPIKPQSTLAAEAEWLATLADQKRRDAAKASAKSYAPGPGTTTGIQPETPPFTISAQQAVNGFVMAEILGPPVSMR